MAAAALTGARRALASRAGRSLLGGARRRRSAPSGQLLIAISSATSATWTVRALSDHLLELRELAACGNRAVLGEPACSREHPRLV